MGTVLTSSIPTSLTIPGPVPILTDAHYIVVNDTQILFFRNVDECWDHEFIDNLKGRSATFTTTLVEQRGALPIWAVLQSADAFHTDAKDHSLERRTEGSRFKEIHMLYILFVVDTS